jgi:pyruvate carboxylase
MKSKSIADNEGPLNYREKGRELAGRKSYGGRMAGIEKAKVMAKEEAELEEKLDMKKASMGTVVKDFQKSDAPQFQGKSQKKRQVMAVAAKLTAERGKLPMNKEQRLLVKLDDLAEVHKRTMVSVFEKLNEDNQREFMLACDTAEGIEQMLDFSISYRGE